MEEGVPSREEPKSWEELYNVNLVPSELFLKFRKEIQGFRVGVNLEVGIGHNFQLHATGWKWKLTTCLGGDGVSRIRNKTSLGLCPGVDFRFGWRAVYVLPEITGRGLSNFYAGKLKSYTSLADATSSSLLKDMVKQENAYTRKRKNLLAHSNFFDKNRNPFPRINRVG